MEVLCDFVDHILHVNFSFHCHHTVLLLLARPRLAAGKPFRLGLPLVGLYTKESGLHACMEGTCSKRYGFLIEIGWIKGITSVA